MSKVKEALAIPDPREMRGEIREFMDTKALLVSATMSIVVTDDDSCLSASKFLASTLVPLRRRIEQKRQQYSTSLRRLATEWDKEFTPALEAVDGLIGYLKEGVLAYTRVKEEEARQLQEELDRKAEEERKATEASGEVSQIPEAIVELAPTVERTTRTSNGTTTVKKVPYVDIYDESLLPRQYLMPNRPLIEQHVKAGIEVLGVKLSYREEVAVRTR